MDLGSPAIPKITLSNGMTISQLGFGTLSVQPNREASDANAEITAGIVPAPADRPEVSAP